MTSKIQTDIFKIRTSISELYNERKSFGDGSPRHLKIQSSIDKDIFKKKNILRTLQAQLNDTENIIL